MSSATTAPALSAIAVVEQDTNGDVLLAWQYPNLGVLHEDLEAVIARHCTRALASLQQPPTQQQQQDDLRRRQSSFSKFHEHWIYTITTTTTNAAGGGASQQENTRQQQQLVAGDPRVTGCSIVVVAKDFNPEKYASMVQFFSDVYMRPPASTGQHIVQVLQEYVTVFAVDRSSDRGASFNGRDHDQRRALVHSTPQLLLDTLGAEQTLTLWTAMMLRKRVLVVATDLGLLQRTVRSIPTLVWHRSPAVFATLRPLVDLSHEPEREDLRQMGAFVAGSLDTVGARADQQRRQYDVLVDLTTQEVLVPDTTMREELSSTTRLHKALAQTLEQHRGHGPQLIKQLALRTREILQQLEQLRQAEGGDGQQAVVTMDSLRTIGQPRDVERLLFGIAVCENMA